MFSGLSSPLGGTGAYPACLPVIGKENLFQTEVLGIPGERSPRKPCLVAKRGFRPLRLESGCMVPLVRRDERFFRTLGSQHYGWGVGRSNSDSLDTLTWLPQKRIGNYSALFSHKRHQVVLVLLRHRELLRGVPI